FFGVSMHFGGDAIGVRPSTDGFVVKSHGNRTVVTEQVWLFCLLYPYSTLMLTPAAFFLFAVRQRVLRNAAPFSRFLMSGFVCFWGFGWFGSITSAFTRSWSDYQNFKPGRAAKPPAPRAHDPSAQGKASLRATPWVQCSWPCGLQGHYTRQKHVKN